MAPLPYSGEFADKRAVIFERGEEPGVGATGNRGSPLFPTDWRFGCGRHRPPCLWGLGAEGFRNGRQGRLPLRRRQKQKQKEKEKEKEKEND